LRRANGPDRHEIDATPPTVHLSRSVYRPGLDDDEFSHGTSTGPPVYRSVQTRHARRPSVAVKRLLAGSIASCRCFVSL